MARVFEALFERVAGLDVHTAPVSVVGAMCEWRRLHGRLPSSYDRSRTRASARRRSAGAPVGGSVAVGECCQQPFRNVGGCTRGGFVA
jgi:hypothetical protein